MDYALLAVGAVLCIAAVTAVAPRVGVAAPLLLVVIGVGVGALPFVPTVEVEPEWILMGVLPPLLYSAAVSMPAMDFRRDLGAISGLSVLLVVVSSVVIGIFLDIVVPGIDLATGIAVGAIISPTDAVATTIVRRLGVSPRIVTVLQGESLLNDATALVLLRSAVAAAGTSVSILGVALEFVISVVVAIVGGLLVARLSLVVRRNVSDPTVNTAISFAVPFVAYLPVEHVGASGLVAAVVAGLHTGLAAPRFLAPQHRITEEQNWRTIELLLEGGVFLLMGLELDGLVDDVRGEHDVLADAIWTGAVVAVLVVLVRAAYVAPLLWALHRRRKRVSGMRQGLVDWQDRITSGEVPDRSLRGRRPHSAEEERRLAEAIERRGEQFQNRIRRAMADIDYLAAAPLGWREGTIVVWAGMRGVVTLAAAQTLPHDTPHRSLLIMIAFVVAVGTLVVQGGTLPLVVRALGLVGTGPSAPTGERTRLLVELADAGMKVLDDPELARPDGASYRPAVVERVRRQVVVPDDTIGWTEARGHDEEYRTLRIAVIEGMRDTLVRARDDGAFDSSVLEGALAELDADQISLEVRGGPIRAEEG
ncbi:sodium:proton antiporter [Nocardioides sp. YIM 152315]|uniref:cation:proton antiporter n=1 Tax=Nocardioides sp. YIM 152315 TaxID=3031760 RepID=UPI0023D99D97|nr:sodium:proton antiporter [Nocardioides sp. YIM 152315]MDF1606474.1 sodium:proton antiporter [Nocardioides sp. YIM 152315]